MNKIPPRIQGMPHPSDFELQSAKVDAFFKRIEGLGEVEARATFQKDRPFYKWNAATQGAILRGLRSKFEKV